MLEAPNTHARATADKTIRLMAWLSNPWQMFNSSDPYGSPAGIVALIARAHNLGAPGRTFF
jgi:hypothetical protein